jgi:ribose-phosphate pyrophosphokinase
MICCSAALIPKLILRALLGTSAKESTLEDRRIPGLLFESAYFCDLSNSAKKFHRPCRNARRASSSNCVRLNSIFLWLEFATNLRCSLVFRDYNRLRQPARKSDGAPNRLDMKAKFTILSGSVNEKLAAASAQLLDVEVGKCRVRRFPDTEVNIRLDEAVRERGVFIIQSSSPPVDQHTMEVFAIADACRRAAASGITWIAPYLGYARSDNRRGRRAPVMGRLVADFIERAGIDHVIAVDLHSQQLEGFFHIPVENLTAMFAIADVLKPHLDPASVIVSPDEGRVKMASAYASRLGCPVALLHKKRLDGRKTEISRVVGDVRGRSCIIVDDMISTGGTIKNAVEALIRAGAAENVIVAASHAVFTPEARKNLNHSAIRKLIVTDSIPISSDDWPQADVITLAPILAGAIQRSMAGQSMADLCEQISMGG